MTKETLAWAGAGIMGAELIFLIFLHPGINFKLNVGIFLAGLLLFLGAVLSPERSGGELKK